MLYDDRNRQQIKAIVKQLAIVAELINEDSFINNKPHDVTQQAVEVLCKLFQPMPGEVIRSGLHFPLVIMEELYKTYSTLEDHLAFFSLNVIKPALDALSTVDGQCCQYGLENLDMEKGPSRRCDSSYKHPLGQPLNLKLVNDQTERVSRLVDPYDGYVLFHSCVTGYVQWYDKIARGPVARDHEAGTDTDVVGVFGKLMETKAKAYGTIIRPHVEKLMQMNSHA